MSEDAVVKVELTAKQIREVVREGLPDGRLEMLVDRLGAERLASQKELLNDRSLSRSLVMGVLVLSCFIESKQELGVVEIADRLSVRRSNAHRYLRTLVAIGLLEQAPPSHKYKMAST